MALAAEGVEHHAQAREVAAWAGKMVAQAEAPAEAQEMDGQHFAKKQQPLRVVA